MLKAAWVKGVHRYPRARLVYERKYGSTSGCLSHSGYITVRCALGSLDSTVWYLPFATFIHPLSVCIAVIRRDKKPIARFAPSPAGGPKRCPLYQPSDSMVKVGVEETAPSVIAVSVHNCASGVTCVELERADWRRCAQYQGREEE